MIVEPRPLIMPPPGAGAMAGGALACVVAGGWEAGAALRLGAAAGAALRAGLEPPNIPPEPRPARK